MPDTSDRTYRSHTRPKQKHFAVRQTTVRPAYPQHLGGVPNQTTLTQLDFYSPNSSFVSIQDISDDEIIETKPTKRRKIKHSTNKQKTLTQIVRSSGQVLDDFVPISDLDVVQETQCEQTEDCPPVSSSCGPVDSEDEERRSMRARKATALNDHHGSTDILSTPRRRMKREIPSSNTPQSMLVGRQSRRGTQSPTTSPLRARSTNVPMSPVLGSQRIGPQSPYKAISRVVEPDEDSAIVFRKPMLPARPCADDICVKPQAEAFDAPRRLHRVESIIADSQAEDFGEILGVDDDVQSTYIPATMLPRHEHTQFTGVMQATYDPVMSALDRDADRFLPSQMSLLMSPKRSTRIAAEQCAVEALDDSQGVALQQAAETMDEPSHPIDLTDSSQPPESPAPSVATPARHAIKAEPRSVVQGAPGAMTRVTIKREADADEAVAPPTPSRVVATNPASTASALPSSTQSPIKASPRSASRMPLPSPSQRSTIARRLSFTLFTNDTTYVPASSSARRGAHAQPNFRGPTYSDDEHDDLDVARDLLRRRPTDVPGRRLKRAAEILPDSLLQFSLPAAPPWTSSPAVPLPFPLDGEGADEDGDDNTQAGDGAVEAPGPGLGVDEVEDADGERIWDSSPPIAAVEVDVARCRAGVTGGAAAQRALREDDTQGEGGFSLPAPSSDWRSSSGAQK